MKFLSIALLVLFTFSAFGREVYLCQNGSEDFAGKSALVIVDLEAVGELNITIYDQGQNIGSYNYFFIEGRSYVMSDWQGQQADATASFDKVSKVASLSFVLPHQTIKGTFTDCNKN
jgi:hypothetical protein